MNSREFQGLELAARANIEWTGKCWLVPSVTHTGSKYRVSHDGVECTCEDFELTGQPCKHIVAVRHVRARNRGTPMPESPTAETDVPKTKRKTYGQQWNKYNAAQTNEKRVFQHLLADLCGTVDEPVRKGRGRPSVRLSDSIFSAVFKVFSTFSARRFACDLADAERNGHIAKAPHFNVVLRVFDDPEITPILQRLIALSAEPLKSIETTFAVDSSGFGTSRYIKWFDTKHGTERRKAEWVKVHICVGTKTNIVTAVAIGNEHDGQHFPGLLEETAKTFKIGDMTADKAYLSHFNVDLVNEFGGTPFIPMKVNSVEKKGSETWRKMFHQFALKREEFLARYHQRSNVESAFSMMKRKFSDGLRSRTEKALINESLAKILCHNLSCLVHEMYELGICPEFPQTTSVMEDMDEPQIIRFPILSGAS